MPQLEITWLRALKIWWSLTWRVMLFGAVAGFLIGIPAGIVMGMLNLDPGLGEVVLQLVMLPIWFALGVWVTHRVLRLEYADFRLALIPSNEARLAARYGDENPPE